MKVLVINPGATSTKVAAFENELELFRDSIEHSAEELNRYGSIAEQMPFRRDLVRALLTARGYTALDFDAVCGRGGLLQHIPSGTYRVNERVIQDILHPVYGEHASNLGAYIANELANEAHIPAYFVDPVCVDEMNELARVSGLAGIERQSYFHALNHKAIARKASQKLNRAYEDLNLIVVHMGGGVSVAAHCQGRVTDVYNVKDDGSMGMDRAGALPVNAIVDLCYSGLNKHELKKLLGSQAGVFSYLGTKDFREVVRRMDEGDTAAQKVFRALAYQLAKDIGAMAAVLSFQVDAIVYTGGMAYSERLCLEINKYVDKIAPVMILPGEEEMRSLAEGALRVLNGEPCMEYK